MYALCTLQLLYLSTRFLCGSGMPASIVDDFGGGTQACLDRCRYKDELTSATPSVPLSTVSLILHRQPT